MLPLQQAREVRASVLEYITVTFRFKESDVSREFYRFIEDKQIWYVNSYRVTL